MNTEEQCNEEINSWGGDYTCSQETIPEYNSCRDDHDGFSTEAECRSDLELAIEQGYVSAEIGTCSRGTILGYNSCRDANAGFPTETECSSDLNLAREEGDLSERDWTCSIGSIEIEPEKILDSEIYSNDYKNYLDENGHGFFIKHDVLNNIITASYGCIATDKEYCMRGQEPNEYDKNIKILKAVFGEENCKEYEDPVAYSCEMGNMFAEVHSSGQVSVGNFDYICRVPDIGPSSCYSNNYY